MKSKTWFLLLALAAACIIAVFVIVLRPASDKTLRFGATLPLTGDAAIWGKNTQEGVDLAVEEINAQGGVLGQRITIIYEDTRAMPKDGVSAFQKLASVDRVPAIIDDSVSSVTLAMAPLANQSKVVVLATGATAPAISSAGPFIFRIWNSDAYEGEVMADHAYNKMGIRRVAVLYINNDYGTGLRDVFTKTFPQRGGAVTVAESFEQNATDFRTQLTKIKAVNPDGLYLVGYPKEIPVALLQARELGVQCKLLGTVAMLDPQLVAAAGNAAEGLVFPYPRPATGAHVDHFQKAFKQKYGKDPGITSDVGYDAVKMLVAAVGASGGATGEDIRIGLGKLKDFQGVSGTEV